MRIIPNPNAGPRLYKSRRGPVPSVTDILKTVDKPYFAKRRQEVGPLIYDAKMKAAQRLGTKVHAVAVEVARRGPAATQIARPGDPELEEVLKPHAAAVLEFLDMHVLEVYKTELSLVSEKHGFGGTLDMYCRLFDGSNAVLDWKTTSSLTREHGLQVAAYALLLREHGYTVNRRLVVRIKKEKPGAFYVRTYADHAGDVEAFLALKTYWAWANKRKLERAA